MILRLSPKDEKHQMEFLAIDTFETATTRLQLETERFRQEKGQSVTLSRLGWEDIWRELVPERR